LRAVEQLAGVPIPAVALESLVLPARVVDYSPALLDELTLAGDVVWAGAGSTGRAAGGSVSGGWIALAPAELAAAVLPAAGEVTGPLAESLCAALAGGHAMFFRPLAQRAGDQVDGQFRGGGAESAIADDDVVAAIWDLVWAGLLTNDTLAPVRALLAPPHRSSRARTRPPRRRYGRYAGLTPPGADYTLDAMSRPVPYGMAGRWSATPARDPNPTRRALAAADALLDRYGVLTRGPVLAEGVNGGFTAVYPILKAAEESGRVRRGYFVEGLGAAQFALPGAVDRLRAEARPIPAMDPVAHGRHSVPALVLAATDPANPYGAALAWPIARVPEVAVGATTATAVPVAAVPTTAIPSTAPARRGHQPARKAGALVVLVDGACVLYVERGGRTVLSFSDDPTILQPAADALALAVRDGALGKLAVERADGVPVVASPLGQALTEAGFRPTPRGLRLRG
jgi:ATP-dependent Lhr-like helicase